MENSLLSSINVKLDDQAFNLCADDSEEPVILEDAIHINCAPCLPKWYCFWMICSYNRPV